MDGGPELNDQSHHHQRELREEIVFSLWSKAIQLKFLVTFLKVLLIVKERERLCIERPTSR